MVKGSGSEFPALLKCLNAQKWPLKTCLSVLQELSNKLGGPANSHKVSSALTWSLKEKGVQKLLKVLQNQRSNLILALTTVYIVLCYTLVLLQSSEQTTVRQ